MVGEFIIGWNGLYFPVACAFVGKPRFGAAYVLNLGGVNRLLSKNLF